MTQFAQDYEPSLKYGAVVKGSNQREGAFYGSVSVNSNGTAVNVPLFGTSTKVGFEGTITNVNIIAPDTTKGTIDLVSDQGTICRLIKNGTAGGGTGSVVTPIAFQNGSLLYVVSAGADNANLEAVFYTFA
jgi:hypothetical protein